MKTPYLFEIPRRAPACALGKEPFTAGMEYYSTLETLQDSGLERKDYCVSCWDNAAHKELLNKSLSHWKSKVQGKKDEHPLPQDRTERALELLRRALANVEETSHEEAFVLALYLARRRKLYLRQELQQANGEWISLYEVAATEEMLAVKKIALSSLQTEKVQTSLAHKFRLT